MDGVRVGRVLIATGLIFAIVGVAAAPTAAHPESSPRRERNVRPAAQWAEQQLHAVSLPPGSRPTRSLPRAATQLFQPDPVEGGTVVRRRFWIVPRDPAGVFRWVENHGPGRFHRPRGGEFDGNYFGEEPTEVTPSRVSRRPGVHGVLGSELIVHAVRLAAHRSAVRIEDQVRPVRPRPAGERIPIAVTKIELKLEHHPEPDAAVPIGGESPLVPPSNEGEVRSLTIRAPHRVGEIVRLVDRLRVVQPVGEIAEVILPEEEVVGEPGAPLPSTVHLLFESTAGRVLAEASQREHDIGGPMRFAVGGKVMQPLEPGVKVLRALIPERRRAVQTRPPNGPPRLP